MNAIASLDFHGHPLTTIQHNGVPHVAMKPIVEAIGLDWRSQLQRIKRHPVLSEGVAMITTPSQGGEQRFNCLPVKYLNGWLFGIDVNRVKPECREPLLQYQRECFDVLNDYWNKGAAINHRLTITPEQRAHLSREIHRRAKLPGHSYQAEWKALNNHCNVTQYSDIKQDDFAKACSFLHVAPLEGEHIPYQATAHYNFPANVWQTNNQVGVTGWLTRQELERMNGRRPLAHLLEQLEREGNDIEGAAMEYKAMKLLLNSQYRQLDNIGQMIREASRYGMNITLGT